MQKYYVRGFDVFHPFIHYVCIYKSNNTHPDDRMCDIYLFMASPPTLNLDGMRDIYWFTASPPTLNLASPLMLDIYLFMASLPTLNLASPFVEFRIAC